MYGLLHAKLAAAHLTSQVSSPHTSSVPYLKFSHDGSSVPPNSQQKKQQVTSPITRKSNRNHALESNSQGFRQHFSADAKEVRSVHKQRSPCHSNVGCSELNRFSEAGIHKYATKDPPKAIVTPLVGGVAHTKSCTTDYTTDSSSTVHMNTSQSKFKKPLSVMTVSDDDLSKSQASGWKTLLETKDKILAQKTCLIER